MKNDFLGGDNDDDDDEKYIIVSKYIIGRYTHV